jgi:hypothetical protein
MYASRESPRVPFWQLRLATPDVKAARFSAIVTLRNSLTERE